MQKPSQANHNTSFHQSYIQNTTRTQPWQDHHTAVTQSYYRGGEPLLLGMASMFVFLSSDFIMFARVFTTYFFFNWIGSLRIPDAGWNNQDIQMKMTAIVWQDVDVESVVNSRLCHNHLFFPNLNPHLEISLDRTRYNTTLYMFVSVLSYS